jgi:hypothetical protein
MRAKAKLLEPPSIIQIGDHMPNESRKQKIYDTLRGQISGRLIRALDAAEEDVETLSLGELINALFLMYGDRGSLGNSNVSFNAAFKMVGEKMMWHEPEPKPVAVEPEQRVN